MCAGVYICKSVCKCHVSLGQDFRASHKRTVLKYGGPEADLLVEGNLGTCALSTASTSIVICCQEDVRPSARMFNAKDGKFV